MRRNMAARLGVTCPWDMLRRCTKLPRGPSRGLGAGADMTEKPLLAEKTAAPGRRGVGRPRQLSLEQILSAAGTIGLNDLTLQAVADVLHVTTPALYRHVQNREDLIAKFAAAATCSIPVPLHAGESWRVWAERYGHALLALYSQAPGMADYSVRRTPSSAPVLERHETSIRAARESGYDEVGALYATRAVIEFVSGWVARTERRGAMQREHGVHPDDEFRAAVEHVGEDYPRLLGALRAAPPLGSLERFEFTLQALLDGLDATMARRAAAQRPVEHIAPRRQKIPR